MLPRHRMRKVLSLGCTQRHNRQYLVNNPGRPPVGLTLPHRKGGNLFAPPLVVYCVLDTFDPCSIADPDLRRLFLLLLNEREEVLSQLQVLQQENQRLQDEIRKLKGLSPRPKFPRGGGGKAAGKGSGEQKAAPPSSDHSSESERAEGEPKLPWKKKPKLDRIRIDRTVVLTIPPEQLPPDAVFKSHHDVVVQNLIIIPCEFR